MTQEGKRAAELLNRWLSRPGATVESLERALDETFPEGFNMIDAQRRIPTEDDFRKDEFKGAKAEDYEFDSTGELVRKDRFEKSMRSIAMSLGLDFRAGWKCSDVVEGVEALTALLEDVNNGGAINPVGECIRKLTALGSTQWEVQQ